jgi:hypothetical protein
VISAFYRALENSRRSCHQGPYPRREAVAVLQHRLGVEFQHNKSSSAVVLPLTQEGGSHRLDFGYLRAALYLARGCCWPVRSSCRTFLTLYAKSVKRTKVVLDFRSAYGARDQRTLNRRVKFFIRFEAYPSSGVSVQKIEPSHPRGWDDLKPSPSHGRRAKLGPLPPSQGIPFGLAEGCGEREMD